MKLLLLDARAVDDLIEIPAVIDSVEEAFKAYGCGEARMPPKVYLDVPEGDFRAMPAYLPGAAGVKWINVHAKNPERGSLPSVMGLILYNDPATGQPLALLDGTLITKYRTGGAAAVATRTLARPDSQTIGIIGCGAQAESHLAALAHVMKVKRVFLADLKKENAERVAGHFTGKLDCMVTDIAHACQSADVISTLTPSRHPFVRCEWIHPGTHINAVGADAPGKQELEIDLLLAAKIFVDDWAQASHSGEINVAYEHGRIREVAGSLPDILCGKTAGRTSPEEITIFDSTGLAIQDLSTAKRVYEEARRKGSGLEVDFSLG